MLDEDMCITLSEDAIVNAGNTILQARHKIDTQIFMRMLWQRPDCIVISTDSISWFWLCKKILIHSGEMIENALLPIGLLTEEAAKAWNKQYRQNYARIKLCWYFQ